MHLEGAILRHRVSMGRIQISTLSSSSCLAIWTVTQHDKRRGNVEATSLSYDIRRLRLRTYGGGCDGGGGSFERLGPSNPNGSLMDTVMVSWRFTVSYVRHWIKSSQKVKHVEAYPPTPPTARGSASEKTLQPANASKLQDPERGKADALGFGVATRQRFGCLKAAFGLYSLLRAVSLQNGHVYS